MKLIVAGSRRIDDFELVQEALERSPWALERSGRAVDEIICGDADGVDQIAQEIAETNNLGPNIFEADWNTYGKTAGPIRNGQMATEGDGLLAIWDGDSDGTQNMISEALQQGLEVYVFQPDEYR